MRSESPLVTIGISTYNRADSYLSQALDAALAQTYPNLEVVVSDNCSNDHTEALVRQRGSERLRYFRQERNIGANANFNFCLDQARGRYFLLLHDDDRIDHDFVEACMRAAAAVGEVGIIRTGTRVIDDRNQVLAEVPNLSMGLTPAELFLQWFDRKTSFYLCSTLYHTERLREAGGFGSKTDLFQDVVALARLAVPFGRVDVPAVKASFRRHGQNKGSGDEALAWAQDSLFLLKQLAELMPAEAERLLEAGKPYLCRKCYRNVGNIASLTERWRTYASISRMFGGACPPLGYLLEQATSEFRTRVAGSLRSGGARQRRMTSH